ncbi:MAG TPA: glycosyltransferase family 4 protein [Dermatophilaceae bacterium]|nr:glycosyltransferase family 4 protein [Dermatophilaceae bacterium]
MRIGMVCPYSFDVPGGVQFHVRDLAEHFRARGHEVSVLAPADDDGGQLPAYLVPCGRAVPVRYNGSVARLTFGPVTSARVGRWLDGGDFDVVHLHEPVVPSVSLLTLWAVTDTPVVATFHTANLRSRAMHAANPVLRPSLEKIRARIAVSEDARRTVRTHLGGDAYIIPNGVEVARFGHGGPDPRWAGTAERPTIGFLGRIDEPRKGLGVLLAAMPEVLRAHPGARLVVAGPGDAEDVRRDLHPAVGAATELLGGVSEADKAAMLRSVDLFVAPHTGGESFGIVLVEAMASGAPVVASDLAAFSAVLGVPSAGVLVPPGDPAALARGITAVLGDPHGRRLLAGAGRLRAADFDWSVVAERIQAVYEMAIEGADGVVVDPLSRTGRWGRLVRGTRGSER